MNILKRISICMLVLTLAFSMTPFAMADSGDATAKMNKKLMNKINQLENRIKQLEKQPTTMNVTEVANVYTPEVGGGLVRAAEDIKLSGYVEANYSLNTNNPNAGALSGLNTDRASINDLRTTTRNNASFVMNALKLTLEKEAPETGGLGFRADLIFGEEAKWLNAMTGGAASAASTDQNNVYIENAYGILRMPYGNGIDLYFGRMTTLIGVEVIESKDNWNASKGLLFNFGMPYANTGIRMAYQWNDKFETVIGLNNGADLDINNSKDLTVEGKASYQLTDKIKLTGAMTWGNETPEFDINGHAGAQLILDSIVEIEMTDKWDLKVESLFGHNSFGDWYGLGVWNRYELNDWIAFNNRFEFFNDTSNARLGLQGSAVGGTQPTQNDDGYDAWEITFGMDFKVYTNLLARLEYRFDSTPGTSRFRDGQKDNQSTFLAQAIYSF